jgi:hypothetical protein
MKGMGLAKSDPDCRRDGAGDGRVAISTFQETPPKSVSPEDVYKPALCPFAFREAGAFHRRAVRHQKTACYAPKTISIGTLDSSLVHPREVYRAAIREGAACWIAAHNHPQRRPDTPAPKILPSPNACATPAPLLGIELLDHIIIGDGRYTSFFASGGLL